MGAVVEHPIVYETLGYFRGGNLFYGYRLSQLREAIGNDQEVFVTTRRRNEFSEYVDGH